MAERIYRVLWIDAAGEGRFNTVRSASIGHAVWQVARDADSQSTQFEDYQIIDEGE